MTGHKHTSTITLEFALSEMVQDGQVTGAEASWLLENWASLCASNFAGPKATDPYDPTHDFIGMAVDLLAAKDRATTKKAEYRRELAMALACEGSAPRSWSG